MTPKKQKKKATGQSRPKRVFLLSFYMFDCCVAAFVLLFFAFVLRPLVGVAFLITFLVLFWRFFNCCSGIVRIPGPAIIIMMQGRSVSLASQEELQQSERL